MRLSSLMAAASCVLLVSCSSPPPKPPKDDDLELGLALSTEPDFSTRISDDELTSSDGELKLYGEVRSNHIDIEVGLYAFLGGTPASFDGPSFIELDREGQASFELTVAVPGRPTDLRIATAPTAPTAVMNSGVMMRGEVDGATPDTPAEGCQSARENRDLKATTERPTGLSVARDGTRYTVEWNSPRPEQTALTRVIVLETSRSEVIDCYDIYESGTFEFESGPADFRIFALPFGDALRGEPTFAIGGQITTVFSAS
ncbi:hypothetical protein JL108_19475 [Aeromicrobium sp. YIM 150415]|uniref:hypothetical protein n=1 Tax=Aeromicrobium sp. YIM 150415 TaxID=2803912 RepID=UPI0019651BF9|nr:hypothetical protein [Aeromicrobium sp. YIM 150415]MBM9465637.1 hypothetical protein [Aeromicrobium sp. YIM 150415]